MARLIHSAISFALCLSLIVLTLASCGTSEKPADSDLTTASGSEVSTIPATTGDPRLSVSDDLPEKNYNGAEFVILWPDWSSYPLYYFAEDENGDIMNDALYMRQKRTEERFNVVIKPTRTNSIFDIQPAVKKAVQADTKSYDLVLTHCITGVPALMGDGLLSDWNTLPGVNLSKPWWNQSMNETISLNGKLFVAVSDFIIPEPNAVFFNKDMIKSYGLENPYDLVRSGTWTWDKLYEMAKSVGKDLNGDGKYDLDDQYGLVTQLGWMMDAIPHSCGLMVVVKDETGRPVVNNDSAKMQDILTKANALFNDPSISYTYPYNDKDQYTSPLPMSTGRCLFHIDPLPQAIKYRGFDIDYGVLPYPKYNQEQKEYLSLSWNGFMAVPSNVKDPEMAGIIIEALSAESYKYCVPAFYDVLMNVKLTRDNDSVEMLDIIYKGCVYDIGVDFTEFDPIYGATSTLLISKSKDFISYYEKNAPKCQSKLDKLYEKIINMG